MDRRQEGFRTCRSLQQYYFKAGNGRILSAAALLMGQPKIKRQNIQSPIKQVLAKAKEASAKDLAGDDCMLLSFKHLDRNQGDSFADWDLNETLSDAIESLYGYSHGPIRSQAVNEKFTIYGGFPPKDKTEYFHPSHVPEDAEWARIHVNGKQCIIGHVVPPNTFYVVFLDGNHRFWISKGADN